MKIGTLVRHKDFGDIGIVTYIGKWKLTFTQPDGRVWCTYHNRVEAI